MAFQPVFAETYYVENEWNYADGSMDVSHGIPDNATGVMDRIKRNGVLKVGTEPYFAPFEFIDPEQLDQRQYVGADMKLAALIAERMGVALEIIPMEFTQVLPALTENQCDLTISAIAFTPNRASSYAMSKGYYFPETSASTAFVIREEDRETITSLDDLADKTIIAQSSSLQEAMASKNIINYREFRRVSSVQAVYEAVRKGRADAGIVDMETATNYIRNNKDAGLVLADNLYFTLEKEYLGHRIVAKKGELQLIYFVNGVIDEVLADGTYLKWIEEAQKRADELGF
jgi:polar amino acid transport system substrate-binding protein